MLLKVFLWCVEPHRNVLKLPNICSCVVLTTKNIIPKAADSFQLWKIIRSSFWFISFRCVLSTALVPNQCFANLNCFQKHFPNDLWIDFTKYRLQLRILKASTSEIVSRRPRLNTNRIVWGSLYLGSFLPSKVPFLHRPK